MALQQGRELIRDHLLVGIADQNRRRPPNVSQVALMLQPGVEIRRQPCSRAQRPTSSSRVERKPRQRFAPSCEADLRLPFFCTTWAFAPYA
jgi:hypothetical protein